jgi:hypothetical protein
MMVITNLLLIIEYRGRWAGGKTILEKIFKKTKKDGFSAMTSEKLA